MTNLSSIGIDIWIENNNQLTDLTPFENLTALGGSLYVLDNALLTSLTGLENIDPGSINNLGIYGNALLSNCDIQSVCEYLAAPNGEIYIGDNSTGCNSLEEVEASCFTEIQEFSAQEVFSISPNPVSGRVNLRYTISDVGYVTSDLFEVSGIRLKQLINEVKTPGTFEMEVDLSDLSKGIYFYILKTTNGIQIKKMIKL